jgi:hypothetical protein
MTRPPPPPPSPPRPRSAAPATGRIARRNKARIGKEESSICEQKEAKKLYPFASMDKRIKVFWFFFSKQNILPS